MLDLAERQLTLGLSVIADSPLGYGTGYEKALDIARRTEAAMLVVECECSDPVAWRRRIEGRGGIGLAAHHATDWSKVDAFNQRAAADPYEVGVPNLTVDTAEALEQSVGRVIGWLPSRR
jgi:predicted kinase